MGIKLLALDMDGTLMKSDHVTISEANQAAIRKAMARGVLFVPATGRMKAFIPQGVLDIPGWRYALTSNGAAVYDLQTDTLLYSDYLDRAVAAEILERIAPLDVFFELYCGGESYIERERLIHYARYNVPDEAIDFFRHKGNQINSAQEFLEDGRHNLEKIYLPHIRPEIYEELAQILSEYDVAVTSSVDTNLEVNSKTANKGSGLAFLAGYLGFTADEVMAVGDNKNDLEMLKFAGCSVAMGNAEESVKRIAAYTTLSNDEDGVAAAIEQYCK